VDERHEPLLSRDPDRRNPLWCSEHVRGAPVAGEAAGVSPERHGVDSAGGGQQVFLVADGSSERSAEATTSVGARSSLVAASGPPAAFNLPSASGPTTRNRHGFVR